MAKLIALLDACVLYSASLRDLLIQLALHDIFRAKWTKDIHNEWMKNLLKNRPEFSMNQLEIVRKLMDAALPDCLVEKYEDIIETINLPDKNDRHVLAAAIKTNANIIITFNTKDFPSKMIQNYGIEVQHPDSFLMSILEKEPQQFFYAISVIRSRLKKPPISFVDYLKNLEQQSLFQTVTFLKRKERHWFFIEQAVKEEQAREAAEEL